MHPTSAANCKYTELMSAPFQEQPKLFSSSCESWHQNTLSEWEFTVHSKSIFKFSASKSYQIFIAEMALLGCCCPLACRLQAKPEQASSPHYLMVNQPSTLIPEKGLLHKAPSIEGAPTEKALNFYSNYSWWKGHINISICYFDK